MRRIRVIPALLLKNGGLYKTVRFKDPLYIGDPINTVKIFNEKGADELFLLDITASAEGKSPNFGMIAEIGSEAFVPVGYGGGVRTVDDVKRILHSGIEKVVINIGAFENPRLISEAAKLVGSQSIVVSIDAKKGLFGRHSVYVRGGRQSTGLDPITCARRAAENGAGEILMSSIDRDGTLRGYDIELVREVASAVKIPVVACGGAASIDDFADVIRRAGASAVAAGSLFVFQKSRKGVLISFPTEEELMSRLYRLLDD